jgi:spore coat polysaccharide biosynthesis predicted glycosyltransferase SpsG
VKETKQKILLHCDADRTRGMGHLLRCSMLHGNLAGPGSLLAAAPDKTARGYLESSGLPWREIPSRFAGGGLGFELAGIAKDIDARMVLLDRKDNSRELVLTLRQQGLLVVDLEDVGPGRLEADILLDPHIQPGSAEAAIGGRATCCFGPEWALIHPEFAARRANSATDMRSDSTSQLRVAVSLGGSDPSGLTGRVTTALAKVDRILEINIVLGPGAESACLPKAGKHKVIIHNSLGSLAKLLASCQLAFVSGGITMFESLCLGVATVVVPQHEEQYINASRLARRNALLVVPPPGGDNSTLGLELAAREVTGNESLRSKLALAGAALVDGQGVRRLESLLLKMIRNNSLESIAAQAVRKNTARIIHEA